MTLWVQWGLAALGILAWWLVFANLSPQRQSWMGGGALLGFVVAALDHPYLALVVVAGVPLALLVAEWASENTAVMRGVWHLACNVGLLCALLITAALVTLPWLVLVWP